MQHNLKSYVEERLMISPLNWTIVKPTNFMDAYPVRLLAAAEKPFMEKLWTPGIPNSVIALRDLAEASARTLNEGSKHYYAEYPLCSTLPVSNAYIIRAIGKAIGKDIEIGTPSFETGVKKLRGYLFDGRLHAVYADGAIDENFAYAAEGDLRGAICKDEAERLILFYMKRGLKGSPNVLRWVLGREPTTVDEWIQLQLKGDDPLLKNAATVSSNSRG